MKLAYGQKAPIQEINNIRVGSWVKVRNDCGEVTQIIQEGQYQFAVRLYNEHGSYAYRKDEVELWKWV